MRRTAVIALAVVLAPASFAGAQDGRKKIVEADLATWKKLKIAERAAAIRKAKAEDNERRASIEKARAAAYAEAGWTPKRFQEVGRTVESILQLLAESEKGGEEAEDAQIGLSGHDLPTVALVKARRSELGDKEGDEKAAQELAKALDRSEPVKKPPIEKPANPANPGKPKEKPGEAKVPASEAIDTRFLEGAWELDVEATLTLLLAKMPEKDRASSRGMMKDGLEKTKPCYTFGPGDSVELKDDRPGAKPPMKETFRIDRGEKLFIKLEGAREKEYEASRREEDLILGKTFLYKRKK